MRTTAWWVESRGAGRCGRAGNVVVLSSAPRMERDAIRIPSIRCREHGYFSKVESDLRQRQVRQIVQS